MLVVFESFAVLRQIEVRIAELTVDGAESLEIVRTDADGRLKELYPGATVSDLAQPLTLQSELHTRAFHRH